MQVDLDEVAAVHIGVRLDRPDQVRHPLGRLLQLAGEAADGQRRRHPSDGGVGGRPGERAHPVEPGAVDARRGQRLGKPPGLGNAKLLETGDQLLLRVRHVECVERRALLRTRQRLLLERDQRTRFLPLDAGVDEAAHGRADHLERLLHLGGGPARRRGRVVQLVRQTGGHRAERSQPLAVLLHAGDPAHHGGDLLHDPLVHRRLRERKAAEVVSLDQRDAAGRVCLHAHSERPAGQHGYRPHPGRRDLTPNRLGALALDANDYRLALEKQLQPRWILVLLEDQLAGLELLRARDGDPLGELLVVDVIEEIDGAQLGERDGLAHAWARYSWISETAIEPSPTALATRLIERARTSPATKTPGTLVSSG